MAGAQHSGESIEHYTPHEFIEAERRVMGQIDFDPFSCAAANRIVGAARFLSQTTEGLWVDDVLDQRGAVGDGFTQEWAGRVHCNPPGGVFTADEQGRTAGSRQCAAWFKLAMEWCAGRARSAVFVAFSLEILQRSQMVPERGALPIPLDFPMCYPSRRVPYIRENGELGTQPPHASAFIFLPDCDRRLRDWEPVPGVRRFARCFAQFGRVVVP
jgi:hypothetical protein